MYFITRDEFETSWELDQSGEQQSTETLSAVKYGRTGPPTEEIVMNRMQNINTPKIEVTEVAADRLTTAAEERMENTDREAMKREILGDPVVDATFSGDPVGGNEEPISTLEEDRGADMEAVEEREAELAEAFETHDAPDAQLEDENAGTDDAPDETGGEEPTAGNEDPAPKKSARKRK